MATNLESLLAASGGMPSFALLDGASIANLYSRLEASDARFLSLLNGRSAEAYLRVSPFIAEIQTSSPRLEKLVNDAISLGGLIWLCSDQPIEKMRSRLFKFYYWRKGKNHAYARIADAMYFSSFMKIANEDQLRMLGAVAQRVVIPRDAEFETMNYSHETGKFHSNQHAYGEVP